MVAGRFSIGRILEKFVEKTGVVYIFSKTRWTFVDDTSRSIWQQRTQYLVSSNSSNF